MSTQVFVRDSTVHISVTFKDSSGAVTNPGSATVTLSYTAKSDGSNAHASEALTQSGNNWTYEWDSSDAAAGLVYGHAATDDSPPVSSVDFQFRLSANSANELA